MKMAETKEDPNISDSFKTGQAEGIAQQKEKTDKNILKNLFEDTGLADDLASAKAEQ